MPVGTLVDLGARRWMWSDVFLDTRRSFETGTSREPQFEKTPSSPSHPEPRVSSHPSLSQVPFCFGVVLRILMLPQASPLWVCSYFYKSPDCSVLKHQYWIFFSSNWISISWFLCLRNLDKILPGILLQHFALLEIQYLPKMRGDEVISLRVSPSSGVSYAYSVLYRCEREFVPASTYRLICTAVVWMSTPNSAGQVSLFFWNTFF